jgi:hypothetical protein
VFLPALRKLPVVIDAYHLNVVAIWGTILSRSSVVVVWTANQLLMAAIVSGIEPKIMNTKSPGRRSHSISSERGLPIASRLRACQ